VNDVLSLKTPMYPYEHFTKIVQHQGDLRESVCLSVCLPVCLPVFSFSACLFVCLVLSVCPSVCLSCLSACLSSNTSLSVSQYVHMSVCLPVWYLSVCPSSVLYTRQPVKQPQLILVSWCSSVCRYTGLLTYKHCSDKTTPVSL
jgi:hypothetical protein